MMKKKKNVVLESKTIKKLTLARTLLEHHLSDC